MTTPTHDATHLETSDTRRIRVLLIEDYPVIREGLRMVIEAQQDMTVVGEAESIQAAIKATTDARPHLAILAMRLQGELRGIEICRELKNTCKDIRVLIYTSYNKRDEILAAFLSGADSFLFRGVGPTTFLSGIRDTSRGKRVWNTKSANIDASSELSQLISPSTLTRREQEVLGFMLQRLTNAEIARELTIEVTTVKTHVSSILNKLDVKSRRDLV